MMADKIGTLPQPAADRLAYIDWMRGFACVLMFQTHCYDSWLSPEARKSALFAWSQLGGTFPAPLFLFLSGISFALITNRLREKGIARNAIARTTILRGAEIFLLGIMFRLQEFILAFRVAPWTDLLRVDILNMLGLSMMLMGVLCWVTAKPAVGTARTRGIIGALVTAAAIALLTPHLWIVHRPRFLPWPIESYFNGVHIFNQPQPWLFPFFPWAAFAFAGLAVGFFLFSNLAKQKETLVFVALGATGIFACGLSFFFDALPIRFYPVYDYWHTSPNFFLMRCGILLVILFFVYAWCRRGLAQRGFSPIIQLGKTSLLVYWVHIEFVYGGLSILRKRQCTVLQATLGLCVIFVAMLTLSLLRMRFKRRGKRAPGAALPLAQHAAPLQEKARI
jgi:uncharacterized membrane protein